MFRCRLASLAATPIVWALAGTRIPVWIEPHVGIESAAVSVGSVPSAVTVPIGESHLEIIPEGTMFVWTLIETTIVPPAIVVAIAAVVPTTVVPVAMSSVRSPLGVSGENHSVCRELKKRPNNGEGLAIVVVVQVSCVRWCGAREEQRCDQNRKDLHLSYLFS